MTAKKLGKRLSISDKGFTNMVSHQLICFFYTILLQMVSEVMMNSWAIIDH